jgi:hypothetical protein
MSSLLSRVLLLLGLSCVLLGCASGPKIFANQDPSADFNSYNTFAYLSPLTTDRNGTSSIVSRYLITATTKELTSRGYRLSNVNPDLIVDFHVGTREKISSNSQPTTSMSVGRSRGGGGTRTSMSMGVSSSTVSSTTEGTVVIAIGERARQQVVWEASATGRVTDKVRENLEAVANAAVKDMFKKFPLAPVASQEAN